MSLSKRTSSNASTVSKDSVLTINSEELDEPMVNMNILSNSLQFSIFPKIVNLKNAYFFTVLFLLKTS